MSQKRERELEPPGESLADDLIGDDPEPEAGWRRFERRDGKLVRIPPDPPKPKA